MHYMTEPSPVRKHLPQVPALRVRVQRREAPYQTGLSGQWCADRMLAE